MHRMCYPKERTQIPNFESYMDVKSSVTNQVGQKRGARMNPPSFTRSSTTEDSENFVEELKKVFKVMHVLNAERV